jgi:hypothetical protein
MREAETMTARAPIPGTDPALIRVLETARSFLSYREQVTAIAAGHVPPPRDLGEAIDRDFLLFDLERAAQALREAVAAVPAGAAMQAMRPKGARRANRP